MPQNIFLFDPYVKLLDSTQTDSLISYNMYFILVGSHSVQALAEFVMRPMLGDGVRECTIDALRDKEIVLFFPDRLSQRTYRIAPSVK